MHMLTLTIKVTIFGDRAFKEEIRLNEVIRLRPYSNRTEISKRRKRHSLSFFSLYIAFREAM